MIELIEILKYTFPLIIALGAVIFILKHFSRKDETVLKYEAIMSNQKLVTPLRLQAYERAILLLERIKIDSLALRLFQKNMKSLQMQMLMSQTVRKEYNHNISQQLYLSSNAWAAINNAKEQVIKTINITATKIDPYSDAGTFSRAVMEEYSYLDSKPVETAIELLKNEVRINFGF